MTKISITTISVSKPISDDHEKIKHAMTDYIIPSDQEPEIDDMVMINNNILQVIAVYYDDGPKDMEGNDKEEVTITKTYSKASGYADLPERGDGNAPFVTKPDSPFDGEYAEEIPDTVNLPSSSISKEEIGQSIASAVKDSIKDSIDAAFISSITAKAIEQIDNTVKEKYGYIPKVHEIKVADMSHTFKEATHEILPKVVTLLTNKIPVYLSGKAGVGKNVICKQAAEAMHLDFYFTNAVTQEYKLTGFIDAGGTYHETQFYKAFTKGGLFFLDEMDASIPETLIILNAAIANGYFDFPTGKVEASKDFRVIAAGNTNGTGADSEYTGRYCLDAASLDRFAMLYVGYSKEIEKSISNNDEELIAFAEKFREITDEAGIKCPFTYRAIQRITILKSILPLSDVLRMSLLKGLDVDDINILKNKFYESKMVNQYSSCLSTINL